MFFQSGSSKNQDKDISFDSPYKNIIKNANINWDVNDSYNEENDFRKSTQNKVKAAPKPRTKSKTVSKRKRHVQKTNLVKNFGVSIRKSHDFDLEHVGVALALSKSLQTTHTEEEKLSLDFTQSEDNVLALRANLQKFGFKTSHLKSSDRKLNNNVRQEHKRHGKFKFITPTLFLRTEEDRNRIIANKVNAILLEQDTDVIEKKLSKTENLFSKTLRQFHDKRNRLFNQVELTNFYVEQLGFSPKKEKIDRYLKDWKDIPGRDRSPSPEKKKFDAREIRNTDMQNQRQSSISPVLEDSRSFSSENKFSTTEDNSHYGTLKRKKTDVKNVRCVTPDLFESDEESLSPFKMEKNCHESSKPTSCEIMNKIDFISRSEEQADFDCLSDSQLENSFNVTEYVMKILSHDNTTCLMNYFNSTQITANDKKSDNELSKSIINLDTSTESVTTEQLNFSNRERTKKTEKNNSSSKLIKDQEAGNKYIISNLKEEMNSICSIDCEKHDENTLLDMNSIGNSFQNKMSNSIEESNVNARNAVFKTKTESSIYSNKETDSESCSLIEIDSNGQKEKETSSESEDNLPRISVRKTAKTKSTNFFSKKPSNCKSLGIASENEDIYEPLELLQCNNLVQKNDDMDIISLEREKKSEEITFSDRIKETPVNDFKECISLNDDKQNEEYSCTLVQTPKQQITIKVDNITPMINYDALDTPEICKELDNFGLKPMKRKRGIQMLKYIYESTHPVLQITDEISGNSNENEVEIIKKVKMDEVSEMKDTNIEIVGDLILEKEEDIIFEKKRSSSKFATCAVPLHIAWFNFISCNPQIKENILLYEPLQLEVLNISLREQGYKYNIEDLLNFLDKKCINFRRNHSGKGNRW